MSGIFSLLTGLVTAALMPAPAEPLDQGAGEGMGAKRIITESDVVPVMLLRCSVCHGLRRQEGGLDLRSKAGMLRGGKSGPAIMPGRPGESLLLQKIESGEMPPRRRLVEVSIKVIEPAEVALLTDWIAQGTLETDDSGETSHSVPVLRDADRRFWSFQPPRTPPVPAVRAQSRVRNPIDAFALEKLEPLGLTMSAEADRQTLIRRATFDLLGLPPSPQEVDAFLLDSDPLAYEKLIDRLLSSPHYGERWGRYWLDLAGYADSEGVQHADPIRTHAWRYRDYVIRSFNSDKSYDRFLTEQIAGDELLDYETSPVTAESYDNLVATGFLRLTPDGTMANITNFVPDRLEIIADELTVLSSTVLGLTIQCARCHDHKLEPIAQEDYYRLAAVFKGAYDEHDWLRPGATDGAADPQGIRLLQHVPEAERVAWEAHDRRIHEEIAPLRTALAAKESEYAQKHFDDHLATIPPQIQADVRDAIGTPADRRTEVQKYLASKFEPTLRLDRAELKKRYAEFKKIADEIDEKIKSAEAKRTPKPMIRALWDRGEPSPTYLLRRGNYLTPANRVEPGVPAVLVSDRYPFRAEPPWPGARKTGRRLAFARWLTRADHPLTARVMVNRVWKHHFENGLVASLDNLGRSGQPPTHPELLDWLATEFVGRGWSVKELHRLIMTSSVYRQTSRIESDASRLDPENRWLSRMPVRRLDAESLRDTLLAVAGRLDRRAFGSPDPVEARADGSVVVRGTRRTIYTLQRRTQIPTLLEDFDLPPMNPNCTERSISTVAPQALHLMNNDQVHEWAAAFADRVIADHGSDTGGRVEGAYRIAFGRSPTAEEHLLATTMLARIAEKWNTQVSPPPVVNSHSTETPTQQAADRALINLCHALMNSAELMYVD